MVRRIRKHRVVDLQLFQVRWKYNKKKQSMIFKVVFGKQIHLINSQDKLKIQQFLATLPTIFKALPSRYTLTYYDQDGDQITIKQQEDYQVLLASGLKTAKINIRETQEDFIEQTNEIVIQGDFVEIKEEEKKAELPVEEPKQSQASVLQQEIDDSLIEQKLKKLMPDIISKVKSEITEELSERSRISNKNQPIIVEEPIYYKASEGKPVEEKEKTKSDKVVHFGVTCDSCQKEDIEGARYKCSVCSNFDFCERCQATVEHEHPFLKIKTLKQTPLKIFTVINEDDAPSFEANGQRFDAPPQFENLLHHGFDIVRGFLGGANRQEFKNKCHAAKAEWKKCSEEWKKKHCYRGCEKKEEKVETEVKPEAKPQEKVEPKVEEKCEVKVEPKAQQKVESSRGYDVIKGNANYIVQVFGFTFEKCLKWAQMYPYMSKEELLNFCLTQPNFYN